MPKHEKTLADLKEMLESLGFKVAFRIDPRELKGEQPMTKRTARFHIRKTRSGEYRPYLRAANGEIVGGTETYTTKAGALRWTKRLLYWVNAAYLREPIIDNQKES